MNDIQLFGIFGIILLIAISYFLSRPKVKRIKNQEDPIYIIPTPFENTLKTMSFSDLLGLLVVANSTYTESECQTAFEQLCMAESELMYRFIEDLMTIEQRKMTDMYFNSPETIIEKVKFSFLQS